jgi:asparagine synthase (glutamine-hydrolysing)
MCGIAGIYAYKSDAPKVDKEELISIRDKMLARGPDGFGVWYSANQHVGLAHRRLAIIDLSDDGMQPMHDPDNGNWIVFNGEIYNYAELRSQLNLDGISTYTNSDTEVLLKLFAQKGMEMLNMLRGMYAFSIWDESNQRMYLARDPFGIKPLYIADDGQTLRFASQVKALLVGNVDRRPEPAGHVGFLLWGSIPEPFTLYRGIRSVLAGHWMCFSEAGLIENTCFNSPKIGLCKRNKTEVKDEKTAIKNIATIVHESVAVHLTADVPVGVFLSAGLDSIMIATAASEIADPECLTLSFNEYEGGGNDESVLATEITKKFVLRHIIDRISVSDFEKERAQIIDAMDQPTIDGINTWFVAKAMAKQGIKVALSGIGGDEVFHSYPTFGQLPKAHKALRRLVKWSWFNRIATKALIKIAQFLPSPKYAAILEHGGTLEGLYLLRRSLFMPWEISGLIGQQMASEGLKDLSVLASLSSMKEDTAIDSLAISALEMQAYMKNQLLRDADWAGMAHSVEIRVPFVDMEVLNSAVNMANMGFKLDKKKIAQAVSPAIPENILNRKKTGFSVPIYQWLNPKASSKKNDHRLWAKFVYEEFTKGNAKV